MWERVGQLRDMVNCYSVNRFEGVRSEEDLQQVASDRKEEDRFLAGV